MVCVGENKNGKPEINVGIPVEEIYFDPCYSNVPNFTIYIDGKKKVYHFQNYDGKVGVFPIDYDPSFKYLDSNQTFSETSHVKPKKTDPCPMCGKMMFEPTSIQHFLAGTLVEPLNRELHCSSGHKFCFSCWSDHAQAHLKRDNAMGCLPCPAAGCGEILDLQWAPVILKKADMVNRLIAQRQKHVIESLGLRWCPMPNCGLLVNVPEITDEEYLQLDPMQKAARVGICANGHASCMECNQQAHTPCSCSQLVTWMNMLRDELSSVSPEDETSLLAMVSRYPQARKCPKCPTGQVQKTIGCNITPCNVCHVQVCYVCLEEWNQHTISATGTVYCNRYGSKFNHYARGHDEEKQHESAQPHSSNKSRSAAARHARFSHYAHRFKVHEESWLLEQQVRHVTIERVHEALKLSHEGELKWIHGANAVNPYAEKAMESGAEAMLLKKFEEKDCAVENFYFKSYPAVEFIVQAFEELERDRLFLRWSYPFVFLEFDDKPSTTSGRGGASVTSGAGALQDNRQEFLNLQATFEYFTETLSYLISRNRLRATKEEIEKATRDARAKRIEMEEFIIQYYLTRRPEAAMERVPSTTSSLTSRSSLEDEAEEDDEEPEPVHLVPTQRTCGPPCDVARRRSVCLTAACLVCVLCVSCVQRSRRRTSTSATTRTTTRCRRPSPRRSCRRVSRRSRTAPSRASTTRCRRSRRSRRRPSGRRRCSARGRSWCITAARTRPTTACTAWRLSDCRRHRRSRCRGSWPHRRRRLRHRCRSSSSA